MAIPPAALSAFVAQLKLADVRPRPEPDDWNVHVEHISVPARIAEITEEQYDYWLEVLPPKWMNGGHFCFAEGVEALRLFWHDKTTQRYLCRQLTWDETQTFCRLAGISVPW
jgi:Protein of unknown function (DUF1419)